MAVDLRVRGGWRELEGGEGGEDVIRIYHMGEE